MKSNNDIHPSAIINWDYVDIGEANKIHPFIK